MEEALHDKIHALMEIKHSDRKVFVLKASADETWVEMSNLSILEGAEMRAFDKK